jgi:hypothetical protein
MPTQLALTSARNIKDIEDGIRIQAKILAAQGNHARSVQALRTLLSSKYRAAEVEIKGLNLGQSEGSEIKLTLNDYRQPYQQELAKNKELSERVEALEAQITAMQGKDRPRPPCPLN